MSVILLVEDSLPARTAMRQDLNAQGHDVVEWSTPPKGFLRQVAAEQPDLLILAMEKPAPAWLKLCDHLKSEPRTQGVPILVIAPKLTLGEAETLFNHGVAAYLPRPFRLGAFRRQVAKLLHGTTQVRFAPAGGVPDEVREAFARLKTEARRLGDMAEIFHGLTPRDRRWQRLGRPDEADWYPLVTQESVEPFHVGAHREYIKISRHTLTHMPGREEYDQEQKIVVKRTRSPLVAALDNSRDPVGPGLYSIVTLPGLEPAYVTAALSSRMMDFYLHRIRVPTDTLHDAYLSKADLEVLPLVLPDASDQKPFEWIVQRLRGLYGLNDAAVINRERASLLADLNRRIFDIHGLDGEVIRHLSRMHY